MISRPTATQCNNYWLTTKDAYTPTTGHHTNTTTTVQKLPHSHFVYSTHPTDFFVCVYMCVRCVCVAAKKRIVIKRSQRHTHISRHCLEEEKEHRGLSHIKDVSSSRRHTSFSVLQCYEHLRQKETATRFFFFRCANLYFLLSPLVSKDESASADRKEDALDPKQEHEGLFLNENVLSRCNTAAAAAAL